MTENMEEKLSHGDEENLWRDYDPKKVEGIKILVCGVCQKHHYHMLKIGGKVYAQCGTCQEIYRV